MDHSRHVTRHPTSRHPFTRHPLTRAAGVTLTGALLLLGASPLAVADAGDTSATLQVPAEQTCTITDARLPEISGAVATAAGVLVANDKGAAIATVDAECRVTAMRELAGAHARAVDVEDLALGPDGTVWLVDAGGNKTPRDTITLWGDTRDGAVVVAEFAYPFGTHDAEAAVVTADSRLVLFTKERGRSQVFHARIPGVPGEEPVELVRAGVIDVADIGGRAESEGSLWVTGAALSPDGRHMALRTYTDVYEWAIESGDLVETVLEEEPARLSRLVQVQGEAISYSADGTSLLALSEQLPSPVLEIRIRRSASPASAERQAVPAWYVVALAVPGLLLLVGAGQRVHAHRPVRTEEDAS